MLLPSVCVLIVISLFSCNHHVTVNITSPLTFVHINIRNALYVQSLVAVSA